ncbi:squalene/phytoene synthase family protein [Ruegeria sp. HKCCD4884]|uniref:15-cis-phytoene synthase n=1 Tax=Ruegeria sp. HKCCD4884 TaxID=2683022 RepID=UPI001492FC88|nr:phytoene/squalene synthase family protein [Ruegeria sp. HKCCD4884]NOD91964.1 squalene/phytoene synthase family protein [Ruegeria sp. HKCCD4884]
MIDPQDMQFCRDAIRHGSLSFHAASKLLPQSVRDPALALYAFCRLADDEVDLKTEKAAAVLMLKERLELVYAGRPRNAAPDRAFAALVQGYEMPRALPEALLEGLAWDAMERRYDDISDLIAYSARVASAVGVMMSVLMGERDADALARACDLGVAMQLTNIARDVGEDARENRLYLPLKWLKQEGVDANAFMADPRTEPGIRICVSRLLKHAQDLYVRSETGIAELPLQCRPGIYAARFVYAGIGGQIRKSGFDSVSQRARTGQGQKLGWLMWSLCRTALSAVAPRSPRLYARPLTETAFLVDAAAHNRPAQTDWSDTLYTAFAQLQTSENARRRHTMASVRTHAR